MSTVKAIETVYNGYRFRSRLEARWAVFFDTLGIPYEYEKEGYDLDGVRYLPDFWLPQQECWVEVKGQYPTDEECEKAAKLCAGSGHPVLFCAGQVPQPRPDANMTPSERMLARQNPVLHDGFLPDGGSTIERLRWIECFFCGRPTIADYHPTTWAGCKCYKDALLRWGNTGSWLWFHLSSYMDVTVWDQATTAYEAARQARFEHGERGYQR